MKKYTLEEFEVAFRRMDPAMSEVSKRFGEVFKPAIDVIEKEPNPSMQSLLLARLAATLTAVASEVLKAGSQIPGSDFQGDVLYAACTEFARAILEEPVNQTKGMFDDAFPFVNTKGPKDPQ